MKEFFDLFREKWKFLWKTFFFNCCIPALFCFCFVELCSRRSVVSLLLFFIKQPVVFFYNVLIIAITASVCLLFKRRTFVLSVVMILWAIIGITDFVLLNFRTTPFTAVDFTLIQDALAIAHRYLSWVGIILIILGAILVLVFCVILFRKAKKEESVESKVGIPFCVMLIMLCLVLTDFGMNIGLLERNFGNIAQAFHDNGLPYCFMNSVLNTGIKKPDHYSEELVDVFLEEFEAEEGQKLVDITPSPTESPKATKTPIPTEVLKATETPVPTGKIEFAEEEPPAEESESVQNPDLTEELEEAKDQQTAEEPEITESPEVTQTLVSEELPNIIFLQLESFFDVKYIENFSTSEDPIPFFTFLKEKYPSGFLEVPSIGAGTANTEFECITGMNLDLFGPGEYPYKTIIKDHTCESLAYILKNLGFSTTAMHNNDGVFYGRNEVFANLGFDRYISMEYMNNLEYNELNWAKDRVLVEHIMKVLTNTEEQDFIYAISVQGHGAYPEEPLLAETVFDVQLPEELSEYYYQYLYYVHQLKEMDDFLKELIFNLNAYQENVVLVLYGDHLPSLGLTGELLSNENSFQTEYVVWSNFDLTAEDRNLQSYQLSARVLEMLGIEEGIMPKYHIYRREEEDYLENMQLLMYDMLYGNQEMFDGVNPYEAINMQMGLEEICIEEAYIKDSPVMGEEQLLYVRGQNFTEWSKIVINQEEVETIFLTEELLVTTTIPDSKDGAYYVKVCQKGNYEMALSETKAMAVHNRANKE